MSPRSELRSAVITGASSGIGAAIARRLVTRHPALELWCLSRRAPELGEIAVGDAKIRHLEVDLSDRPALLDVTQQLQSELQRSASTVDLLVHAAGVGSFGSLEEQSPTQIAAALEVNLLAPLFLTRALIPSMKRAQGGHVIFVGSESALRGARQGTVYCASKFGLRGFARALRDEVARAGLRVTSIHPGLVRTPFFDRLGFEPGEADEHALSADDVADLVLAALELPPHAVVDEIEVSPLQHVVRKKPQRSKPASEAPASDRRAQDSLTNRGDSAS